jgi:hypothetical protein
MITRDLARTTTFNRPTLDVCRAAIGLRASSKKRCTGGNAFKSMRTSGDLYQSSDNFQHCRQCLSQLVFCCSLIYSAVVAFAQRPQIELTVTDENGVAVPGAEAVLSEPGLPDQRLTTNYGGHCKYSTGGVIAFRAGMGDNRFRFNTTDFLPSFRQVNGGIHFDKFVPRVTFSGPIVRNKAWFFDGLDLEYDNIIIAGLPSNANRSSESRHCE